MSVAPLKALPDYFAYNERVENKESSYWDYVMPFLWPCTKTLRNAFYLPLYQDKLDPSLGYDQKLAGQVVQALQSSNGFCSFEVALVRKYFSVRDMRVHVQDQICYRTFTIRLFESKAPIQGKTFRILLFCFYGNEEAPQKNVSAQKWAPLTIRDLEEGPLSVLKALQNSSVRVDSLVTTSLGNVILDAFRASASPRAPDELIPFSLVINRGLTSTKKVADRLYSFPFNYFLSGAAQILGWSANPEQGLLDLLGRGSDNPKRRQVVIIEARSDYYFSGKGGFDPNIHEKIKDRADVFRVNLYAPLVHVRAQHSLSLDHFACNSETQVLCNTALFSFSEGETVPSLIAREIFHRGDENLHTCFYMAGNDATLDVATVRDVLPLLSACIEQGEKKEELAS